MISIKMGNRILLKNQWYPPGRQNRRNHLSPEHCFGIKVVSSIVRYQYAQHENKKDELWMILYVYDMICDLFPGTR